MIPDESNYNSENQEYSRHSLRRKKRERMLRKQRKKLKRLKSFLRFILFLAILALGYFLVKLPGWYLAQNTFSNPNPEIIQLSNVKLVPPKVVYNQLKNIQVSKLPIFLVSVKPIKKELFKIPVFKNIYVRRYGFPARLEIIVKERVPAAVIKTDLKSKPIAFVTTDGILVTNRNFMGLVETKSVVKILANNPKIGTEWNVKRIEYIEKIVKSVEAYSSENVEYIDMRNPNDVYVRIDSTMVRLGLPDSTVFERIKRLYTILPKIDEVEGTIQYIDLSWDKVNYLKMKKSEPE